MTAGLFRPEAVENRRRRLWGEVIIVQPVSHGVMTAVLSLFTVAAATYLVTGTYAKTETVQGYVAPTGGLAQVYASKGGIVTAVLAHEGDVVAQGQPLVALSLETAGTDGPVGEKLRLETQARIRETDAQIAAAEARYAEEGRRLAARLKGIGEELASLDQRLVSERDLQVLQRDDVTRYAGLEANGNGTRLELSRRKQQVLAQEGSIRELERQRESRQGDLRDTQSQLATLPAERADKLAQLRSARSELEQSLAQLDVNRGYVMVAPVAGRVAALQAQPGQTATAQSPLAALVPAGSDLEANLLVPSRAAGLIQPGQEVRLRVDAFPYQRFGAVLGRVVQVSHATYREGELLAPIPYKDPVYRVTVSLERTSVTAYGEDRPLTSGMTLTGDVVTDRRHFIDWVLDPLRAVRSLSGK
ncbi:HlyD family secretion protein [Nitrospirillum bahiense]|uniref:Membrane fusion protein n=1 Tax=Nitrospirillum amazonense TaxID=28077 RepID=A0A560FVG7_9PROT|nr:HlyD family efflux transporter periplasmic adaptor subunit [Nitrospirillum amazonense]TWB25627.1 membrane fusion protein [Nitrospirillum amazonense]